MEERNSMITFTEEDERKNDYKRLQIKFSFMKKNIIKDKTISDEFDTNISNRINTEYSDKNKLFKHNVSVKNNKQIDNRNLEKSHLYTKTKNIKTNESFDDGNLEFSSNQTKTIDQIKKLSSNSSIISIIENDPANRIKQNFEVLNLNSLINSNYFILPEDDKSRNFRGI